MSNMEGVLAYKNQDNVRLLMMVGQDESTYHKYLFGKKSWTGPEGYNCILPKGVGIDTNQTVS